MKLKMTPGEVEISHCPAPITDEYSAAFNPKLLDIIQRFEDKGIDVYVDITRTLADEGVVLTDDMSDDEFFGGMSAYAKAILRECGLLEQDAILLLRAEEDFGSYVEVTEGVYYDLFQSEGEFYDFEGDFHERVVDAQNDEMQQATAEVLEDLYDQEFVAVEQSTSDAVVSEPIIEQPEDDIIGLEGVVKGAGVLAGIVAIAALSTYSVNKFKQRKETNELKSQLRAVLVKDYRDYTAAYAQSETGDDLQDNHGTGEAKWLQLVAPEEIPEYHRLSKEIATCKDEWEQLHANYVIELAQAGNNLSEVESIARRYTEKRKKYVDLVEQYKFVIAKEIENKAVIEGLSNSVSEQIASLKTVSVTEGAAMIETKSGTYSMSSFSAKLAALEAEHFDAVTAFSVDGHMSGPKITLLNLENRNIELAGLVANPEETHKRIIDLYQAQVQEVGSYAETMTDLQQKTAELLRDYHEVFSLKLDGTQLRIQDLQAELTSQVDALQNPKECFDLDTLLEADIALAKISEQIGQFRYLSDEIAGVYASAKAEEQRSIDLVNRVDGVLNDAGDYIEQHYVYIDDTTEKELYDMVPVVNELRDQVDSDKPNFMALNTELDRLLRQSEFGLSRVKAEHKEILQLEQYIEDAIDTHRDEWVALDMYERANSDVDAQTERDIEDAEDDIDSVIDKPLTATAENREALREQANYLKTALARLDELKHDARGDVAREERKREQAREALRQAKLAEERAERARRQARATRARSQTNLPTRRSTGSIGGGSRTRSFGGGTRSGSRGGGRRG